MSLCQYRRTPEQTKSFQLAMSNMHVLYAHDFTATLRIEELTPPDVREQKNLRRVTIYHDATATVREVSVGELCANWALYAQRGWCQAEAQWSQTRSLPASWVIPQARGNELDGRAPMAPETFQELVEAEELVFTHRDDLKEVVRLQKEVFLEKATEASELALEKLPPREFLVLATALPYYSSLDRLVIKNSEMGLDGARALAEALRTNTVLKRLRFGLVHVAGFFFDFLAKACKITTT